MRLKTEVEELKREQKKKQQIGESLFPVSFTSKILYLCTTSLVTSKRKSVFVSLFSICTRSHSTDAYLRENTLIGGGVPIYTYTACDWQVLPKCCTSIACDWRALPATGEHCTKYCTRLASIRIALVLRFVFRARRPSLESIDA